MTPDEEHLDYYAVPSLSHSRLKEIRHSPGHFRWKSDNAEQATDAMNLGSLVHAMLLEPHLVERLFVASPKFDRRTKGGREDYIRFLNSHPGQKVVTEAEWEQASLMAESVRQHPHARPMLDNVIAHGSAEKEYYWTDSRGIERKAKVDGLYYGDESAPEFIVDVKTTIDASPQGFRKSISKFCYGTQMAYYCEAAQPIHRRAIIIAVAKTPPFGVGLYRFGEEAIDRAQKVVDHWLDLYLQCSKDNHWPTYWDTKDVDVPDWFLTSNGVDP
jgi:exodeoxyribonuclease VIII